MKNTVIITLNSEPDGSVTGNLDILFEISLAKLRPADINDALNARDIRKIAFMGQKSGVECSFPLKVGDLIAVWSLVESDAQARFIEKLDGEYTVAY
jgi:hypothetical protein